MPVTGSLNGTISLTDNLSGSIQLQKALNLSFLGTIAEYSQSQSIGTGTTTINLPLSPTQFLYIKNLSTTATVTVTWTPQSGISATIVTLQPSSAIILIENNTTSGISALTVTASVAATLIEYICLG